MGKLKVGDRVRLKGYDIDGWVVENKVGKVVSGGEGRWSVKVDEGMPSFLVFESQCVRIKPKRKAREWEMLGMRFKGILMTSSQREWSTIVTGPQLGDDERVTVREILPKTPKP